MTNRLGLPGLGRFLRVGRWVLIAVGVAVVIFLPYLVSRALLSDAINTGILAIAAYGLYFLYSQSGQMSVGHGALMGLGGYIATLLDIDFNVTFWLALPIAMLGCCIAGLVVALPSIRVAGHYFLIVTFAFAQFATIVGDNWINLTGGSAGLVLPDSVPKVAGLQLASLNGFYYLTMAALALSILGVALIRRTRFCYLLRAARDNERLAASVGMDVHRNRFVAFAVSGLLPGLAGTLYVYYLGFISPDTFGVGMGVNLILVIVLGGSASLAGPLVGAGVLTYLPGLIGLTPNLSRTVFGMILIVIILVFNRGIVGSLYAGYVKWLAPLGRPRQLTPAIVNIPPVG